MAGGKNLVFSLIGIVGVVLGAILPAAARAKALTRREAKFKLAHHPSAIVAIMRGAWPDQTLAD